jgi:hypothetical protein
VIVACYAVANEARLIAESLRSVKAYVDRYVVVDSIWDTIPLNATHSTDVTRRICEEVCYPVPLTYIESDRKLRQEEARNRYLEEVRSGDWAFVIDGDEVLYADHTEAIQTFGWLRHGEHSIRALNIPVMTGAVMFNGQAADMPIEHYVIGPIIHTRGLAPRIFRASPSIRYRAVVSADGVLDNMGVWEGDLTIDSGAVTDTRLTIINHHVRQSFAEYQADAIWETLIGVPEFAR